MSYEHIETHHDHHWHYHHGEFYRHVALATAAIIVVFMPMLVSMGTAITMAMLRNMSHAVMIVILATVTTGAALRMITIIFISFNMSLYMSKATHLFRRITHFF